MSTLYDDIKKLQEDVTEIYERLEVILLMLGVVMRQIDNPDDEEYTTIRTYVLEDMEDRRKTND